MGSISEKGDDMSGATCIASEERKCSSNARNLSPAQRHDLALRMIARDRPARQLAAENGVSRKFVYGQAAKASNAIDQAFAPAPERDDVLFHLPVTKQWLDQFVLALVLHGHSSFRGVSKISDCLLDYNISIAKVHNVVQDAVARARAVNNAEELRLIYVGAHDEIYQARKPVLVGADVDSTYCYLLAAEDHCDETTWGVHLLDLAERGLRPHYTVADGGRGLRAGQKAAWTGVPCHGDVFHAERDLGKLAFYLENRASGCVTAREKLESKMERAKRRSKGQSLSKRLANVREAEVQAVTLAQEVRILADWMQKDILSLAGPNFADRARLFDFVVDELRARERLCSHRIAPVRRKLENQRGNLLAFVNILDEKIADIAVRFAVPTYFIHAVCELQNLDQANPSYWQRQADLRSKLEKNNYHQIEAAVLEAMADTPRASSIVENINSRLRNYFFLRRHIGNDYLDLLRFFLNHHRFLRSERPERVGKSPAELLTGKPHAHWLELLGFELLQRN